ncbi:MAG: hypothetical protein JXB35_02460 [Anaerolineae bacterium]|nr:hypothetical protein [Anaerolineae bacterium]
MRKVDLIVPEGDVVAVTEALAASNVFHLARSRGYAASAGIGSRTPWQDYTTAFFELEQRVLAVMQALGADEGHAPQEGVHLLVPSVARRDIERLEREAEEPSRDLEMARQKLAKLEKYLEQIQLIADLDVRVEMLRQAQFLFVLPGTIPLANIDRLRVSLEHVPIVLTTLSRDEHVATVILFGVRRDADVLTRAARSAYLNPIVAPEVYTGTPADVIKALEASIARTRAQIATAETTLQQLYDMRVRHLRHLLWRIRASHSLVEAIGGYEHLRFTYIISGWTPASEAASLRRKVLEVSSQAIIEVEEPGRLDPVSPPVVLNNPFALRSFEGLVTNYGYPSYTELDPTPLLALTFPLIFGLMFGDVGHGLLLMLAGLLLASRRLRPLQSLSSIGGILIGCGATSMGFGFLYGSLFGFEDVLKPLWLQPLEEITSILLAAVAVGIGVLTLGMLYHILNAALARAWGNMLCDHSGISGMVFYWSLLGLVAGAFMPDFPISPVVLAILAILSGLVVTFSEVFIHLIHRRRPLIAGGVGTYLMQAFFELFETVISFLSNTLSYVRMGAFAVAHGALSLVVFIIAEIISPGKGIGYWLDVVLGNLFVIGFEGMIVAIQTLRLEYYEFFSKFFAGGGERYSPFSLFSKEDGL